MTHEERQLLDEAMIKNLMRHLALHMRIPALWTKPARNVSDPCPSLGICTRNFLKSPQTRRLANILNRLSSRFRQYVQPRYKCQLGQQVYGPGHFELTGDLLTVGMFVALISYGTRPSRIAPKKKAIFIDETWQLIGASSNKLAAEYVLEIFKIVRGYGGSAICATQDLDDFLPSKAANMAAASSTMRNQDHPNLEDEEAQRAQELLHLSETETLAITHFERGNGLISTNNNNVTVEFKASELEKELITTDRRELQQLLEKRSGRMLCRLLKTQGLR